MSVLCHHTKNNGIAEHNDPAFTLTLYTKRNAGPWRLVYFEIFGARSDAMRRVRRRRNRRFACGEFESCPRSHQQFTGLEGA